MITDLIWSIAVGLIAGWASGKIMKGGGYGAVMDIVLGVVGAVVGGWLMGIVGIHAGGFIGTIIIYHRDHRSHLLDLDQLDLDQLDLDQPHDQEGLDRSWGGDSSSSIPAMAGLCLPVPAQPAPPFRICVITVSHLKT